MQRYEQISKLLCFSPENLERLHSISTKKAVSFKCYFQSRVVYLTELSLIPSTIMAAKYYFLRSEVQLLSLVSLTLSGMLA